MSKAYKLLGPFDMDMELVDAFKARVQAERTSMKGTIERLIRQWLKEKGE